MGRKKNNSFFPVFGLPTVVRKKKKSPKPLLGLAIPQRRDRHNSREQLDIFFFLPFSLCRGKSVRREKSHSFNITSCSRPPFFLGCDSSTVKKKDHFLFFFFPVCVCVCVYVCVSVRALFKICEPQKLFKLVGASADVPIRLHQERALFFFFFSFFFFFAYTLQRCFCCLHLFPLKRPIRARGVAFFPLRLLVHLRAADRFNVL